MCAVKDNMFYMKHWDVREMEEGSFAFGAGVASVILFLKLIVPVLIGSSRWRVASSVTEEGIRLL
jgi:hypothetical protein